MAVAAFNAIRARIRSTTADTAGIRWPDSELDAYIQEAQDEAARIAGLLTADYQLTANGGAVYQLPSDGLYLSRVLDASGNEIPQYPFSEVHQRLGDDWPTQTGDNAHYVITDFDAWNCFRLAPIPPADTVYTVEYARRSIFGELEIADQDSNAAYACAQSLLRDKDSQSAGWLGRFFARINWLRSRLLAGNKNNRGNFF